MTIGSVLQPRASYTPDLLYLRGQFQLGGERLPYFCVSMRVRDAAGMIAMPYEVVLDPRELKLEELFQRELDVTRVNDEIVPYLKQRSRIKFFNALTVVLLPTDERKKVLKKFPEVDALAPPAAERPNLETVQVGTVRLQQVAEDHSIGYISWNQDAVSPVVVDGQHRLYAIKQLLNNPEYVYRHELENTQIPILLLVLDPRAGFESQSSLISVVRTVFVDLNKHAKKVPKARNYLLDDRDVVAVCMKTVIENSLLPNAGVSSTLQRVAERGRVPLALVDWYEETAKFDKGLHVTTVHALIDIVSDCLSLPKTEPTEYDSLEDFIEVLCSRLGLDHLVRASLEAIRAQAQSEQLPFWLTGERVKGIASAFQAMWAPAIAWPLVAISPYAALVHALEEKGALGGDLEAWTGLDVRSKEALATEEEIDPTRLQAVREAVAAVKTGNLAFQVVFQKAIFSALFAMERYRAADIEWQEGVLDAEPSEFSKAWVNAFNKRVASFLNRGAAPDNLDDEFWLGAGIKTDHNIAWTRGSQRAITGFIVTALAAPISSWGADGATESAREWLNEAWGSIRRGRRTDAVTQLLSSYGRHWKSELERAARQVLEAAGKATGQEGVTELALDLGAKRLAKLANTARE